MTGCFVIVITVKIEEAIYDNTFCKITIRKISRWCKVQIKYEVLLCERYHPVTRTTYSNTCPLARIEQEEESEKITYVAIFACFTNFCLERDFLYIYRTCILCDVVFNMNKPFLLCLQAPIYAIIMFLGPDNLIMVPFKPNGIN